MVVSCSGAKIISSFDGNQIKDGDVGEPDKEGNRAKKVRKAKKDQKGRGKEKASQGTPNS